MNLNDPHSVLSLILNAGPVVKVVIAMLLFASLASWTIIFRKRRLVSQAETEANKFEGTFWSGGDLGKLYRAIGTRNKPPLGMESIFEAGFGEFTRLRGQSVPAGELLEGVRRAMRVAQLREIDRLEGEPRDAGDGRLHQSVRRPVRHGLGHHGCVPGPRQCPAGDARDGGARHRRGADRDRRGPVRGDPGGRRLQPLSPTR